MIGCQAEEESETSSATSGSTLDVVKERGELKCGVNDNLTGFGVVMPDGSFEGFDIDRVAEYNDEDVDRLMCDKGIVRNRQKILAIISNAQELQKIVRQHESIASYLNSLTKSGEEGAITTLSERFAHLGPATAAIFLWLVGFYLPDRASYMINKYGADPE